MLSIEKRPFLGAVWLGLLHALLMGAAFPPVGLWPLVFFAVMPLVIAGRRTTCGWRSALGASLGSLPFWAFHHQYVWAMSEAGVFPLVVYLSAWPGLFVWIYRLVSRRVAGLPQWALVPLAWVGLEVLRGEVVWHGYPWFLVAHPTIDLYPMANLASLAGTYAVSAYLCAWTGWLFDVSNWRRLPKATRRAPGRTLSLVAAMLMIGFFLSAGAFRPPLNATGPDTVVVSVVQTNVPQDNKNAWTLDQRLRDFGRMLDLTERAAETLHGKPDLIVWPETMFPGHALNVEAVAVERESRLAYSGGRPITLFHDDLAATQARLGVPMLVGAVAIDGLSFGRSADGGVEEHAPHRFNSALLIEGGAVRGERYDKIHLTPFGETMPYISAWPALQQWLLSLGAKGMKFDLEAGTKRTRLSVPLGERTGRKEAALRVVAPICFEVTVPGLCRKLVYEEGERKADLIVNITNDGWFAWFDAGRENVLLQSRWRCAELGTPMVRAANTGISGAIDRFGRVITLGPAADDRGPVPPSRSDGVMSAVLALPGAKPTLYARIGDAAGWLFLLGLLATVSVAIVPMKKGRAAATADAEDPTIPPVLKGPWTARPKDSSHDRPS